MKYSQRSFLGRIEDALICFQDCLTFSFPLKIWLVVHKIIFDIGIAFELNKLELSAKENSQIKKCTDYGHPETK